jgi:hypothetical protein
MNAWYSTLPTIIQEKVPVTLLIASEYPSLFITWLLSSLKKAQRLIIALEVTTETLPHIQLQ